MPYIHRRGPDLLLHKFCGEVNIHSVDIRQVVQPQHDYDELITLTFIERQLLEEVNC